MKLNYDNVVKTECWNFYRLYVVLSNKKNLPWYVENFIEITLFNNYEVSYYDVNSIDFRMPNYDAVIKSEDIKKESLLSDIDRGLGCGGFPLIYVDMNDILTDNSKKNVNLHEVLIIKKHKDDIYTIIFYNRKKFSFEEKNISSRVIEEAFFKALCYLENNKELFLLLKNYQCPGVILYPNIENELKVNISRVLGSINRNLYGEKRYSEYEIMPSKCTKKNTWKGMSIYRAYYEDLFQEILENGKNFLFEDFRILLGYRKFIESKEGLLFRIKYLVENNIMKFNKEKELLFVISKLEKIIIELKLTLKLMEKFLYTDNIKYLNQFRDILKETECIERKTLQIIKENLEYTILN